MILLFLLIKLFSSVRIKPARTDPRAAEKRRREQFKRSQAAADVIHYTQVKQDLLAAYNASGAASGNTEKAIRRRITYDNALRTVEKKIEKSAYDARTGL